MDQNINSTENNRGAGHKPHRINRKAIMIAIVIFTLIVVGMFTFAFMKKSELNSETYAEPIVEVPSDTPYASVTRVDAKHYFEDGMHTLVGEIELPTPCDLLEAESVVAESYPEQISIQFTVLNNARSCAQVVTSQRFKVSAPASKEATFSASFMGRSIQLNLIPAPEGETPDDFELFIKG